MRGLTVIVTEAPRIRAGLDLACAAAALGARARLFCQGPAVSGFYPPILATDDWHYVDAGLPPLAALLEEALTLGVAIILCQTGLYLTGAEACVYDDRFAWGGPLSVLQSLGEDRLLAV